MPSITGIRMSIRATSGSVRRTTSTASRPSPPYPTTSQPRASSTSCKPGAHELPGRRPPRRGSRAHLGQWEGHVERELARRRTSCCPCCRRGARPARPCRAAPARADAVGRADRVGAADVQLIRASSTSWSRTGPSRVLHRVGERLLHHAVRRDVDPARAAAPPGAPARASSSRPPSRNDSISVGQVGHRRCRPQPELTGLVADQVQQPTGLGQGRPARCRPPSPAAGWHAPAGCRSRSWRPPSARPSR